METCPEIELEALVAESVDYVVTAEVMITKNRM